MGRTMRWVVGLVLAYMVVRSIPDVVRYVKISRM